MKQLLTILFLLLLACEVRAVDVTAYGAKGDKLTLVANVVSNSTTITILGGGMLATDTNKLIEIWNAGIFRTESNECFVGVITAVASSTSITVNIAPSITKTGMAGIYATDSRPAVLAAMAAAALPTDFIDFPCVGSLTNYLLIETNINAFWNAGVIVRRGGLTFRGVGGMPTLTGQGGWRISSGVTTAGGGGQSIRGTLFLTLSPVTNLLSQAYTNLDMYGGLNGYAGGGAGGGPSVTTGEGWDESHHAIGYWSFDGQASVFPLTNNIFGCKVHGWRGEMIICGLNTPSGFMTASNCVFYDGNATVFNMNMAHDWNFCTLSNIQQVEEFYRDYTTNASWFRNSTIYNCMSPGVEIALNGGYYGDPLYTISNNVDTRFGNQIFIATAPACDVLVISNQINGGLLGLDFNITGYQDPTFGTGSSNCVFMYNLLTNVFVGINADAGSGGIYAINCGIYSNIFWHTDAGGMMASGNGYQTNTIFAGNLFNRPNHFAFDGGALPFESFRDLGNNYPARDYEQYPPSSTITYTTGSQAIIGFDGSTMDDNAAHLFVGAQMVLTNQFSTNVVLYTNSAGTGTPLTLVSHTSQTLTWLPGWFTNTNAPTVILTVVNGSGSGTYTNGQVVTITASGAGTFAGWTGPNIADTNSVSTTTTVTNSNFTLVAHFNLPVTTILYAPAYHY